MAVWQLLGVTGVAALVALGFLALGRIPDSRVSRPLLMLGATGGLWAGGEFITALERSMFWEQVGIAVLYTGSIFMLPVWWLLTLRWAAEHRVALPFRSSAWTRWPLIWAGVMWLVMVSNPWHGLFLTPVMGERNIYEPLWWAMALPNYALGVASTGVAVHMLGRTRVRVLRRQALLMVTAASVMLVSNWIYVFRPEPGLNMTLLTLALAGAVVVIGLYREGLFGLLPVALPVIAQHDPDGLVLVRAGGRLAWCNPRARELLAPVALSVGIPFPVALAGHLREPDGSETGEVEAGFEEVWWQQLMPAAGRLYRYGPAGARRLRLHAFTVPGRGGQIVALCLRIRDVTEEERVDAELRRARRLESVAGLARGVAHDFRNLVAVARGNAELLAADLPDDPSLAKRLDRILQAAQRGGELADQLQLYSGGGDARRTPLDLSEIVREAVDLNEPPNGSNARVELDLDPQPLLIEADPTQLRQVVSNLCLNALEALPEDGGEIRAQTGRAWIDPKAVDGLVVGRDQAAGDYAWLRVLDSGSGVEPAAQERIFEPFFSTKGKHRGIGLSTVLGVARAHDALLEFETGPDWGSTFTLYFPFDPRS